MFTINVLRETQEVGVVLGEGGEGVVAGVGLDLEGHVASLARGRKCQHFVASMRVWFGQETDMCVEQPHQPRIVPKGFRGGELGGLVVPP